MKKFISLLLASIMFMALAAPAFAASCEFGKNEETGELYEEFTFDFGDGWSGWGARAVEGKNFNIETDNYTNSQFYGGGEHYTKIYVKEGKKFVITRIEARVSRYANEYGGVDVTAGKKREEGGVDYGAIAHVDNIGIGEFAFTGGTNYVCFDMVRVYFACEHTWNENGKCEYCGAYKCDIAGEHTWNENGKCEYCGTLKCDVTGEHTWNENGICKACEVLKCEVTGTHDSVKETKTPAFIVTKECNYCGEKLSEEVISSENATGSTISEGNMTIIACIACAVVFGFGGFVLGKKKKPTPANVVENDKR